MIRRRRPPTTVLRWVRKLAASEVPRLSCDPHSNRWHSRTCHGSPAAAWRLASSECQSFRIGWSFRLLIPPRHRAGSPGNPLRNYRRFWIGCCIQTPDFLVRFREASLTPRTGATACPRQSAGSIPMLGLIHSPDSRAAQIRFTSPHSRERFTGTNGANERGPHTFPFAECRERKAGKISVVGETPLSRCNRHILYDDATA